MKKLFIAAALAAVISTPTQAAEYAIDTQGAHAFVHFKISHLG